MTHFARWVILEAADYDPRLSFAANHDGTVEAYIDEVLRTTPRLDLIWGARAAYTGREHFREFAGDTTLTRLAPLYAFPGETLAAIHAKTAVRRHIEQFLDRPTLTRLLDEAWPTALMSQCEGPSGQPGWRGHRHSAKARTGASLAGVLRSGSEARSVRSATPAAIHW